MRGVDHTEENRESSVLDIIGVLDTVDSRGPINTQAPHLIGLHDRIGSVEPSVADEKKEEESCFAELEWFVILENVTNAANERRLGRIEVLESLDCVRTGSISQRAQSVLNRLVLVLVTSSSQVEVMIQENEDVLRILDPRQEFVPLVGAVYGETRGLPLLLLGVSEGDGSLHNDVEQLVTISGDFVLREGGDQLHGFQSTVDLVDGKERVPERLKELPVDPADLSVIFTTATGCLIASQMDNAQIRLTSCHVPTGHQYET